MSGAVNHDDIDELRIEETHSFLHQIRHNPLYQTYILAFQTALLILLLALVIATYIRVQHTLDKVDRMASMFPPFPKK